ncbi:MAG: riboflavin synthase [Nitrospira sp.]|nr:riboflavin synthase [bacterium]MBL7049683.1 riboflavin synthase [Nitrospira sp.]
MFTGLVETSGIITSIAQSGSSMRLTLKPQETFELKLGDSVSVNGVCLTVTTLGANISFDVSPETMRSTSLGQLKSNSKVNLERALRFSDRLGGHIVTGHVDSTGTVTSVRPLGEYTYFTFAAPKEVLKYIVPKGSITIDGVSLTVANLDHSTFTVAIIPHTLSVTNLGVLKIGSRVNLEADIIGKYVERLLGKESTDSGLMQLLKEKGFLND